MEFAGRKVAILGLGKSGVALARALHRLGARVLVSDARPAADLTPALGELEGLPVEIETGGHGERTLQGRDLVVLSPGVSVHHPLVQEALARGLPVLGEVEIAFRLCRAPVAAVTGTNGKSTTATLLHQCLTPRSVLAGNIGNPLVGEVEGVPEDHWVVAEISSFQLETVHTFHPRVAVLTNITLDHLDRHPDMDEYFAAKARLFALQTPQDAAVISADDALACRMADLLEAGRLPAWLPGFPAPPGPPRPEILRFSVRGPVERGAWLEEGQVRFRRSRKVETLFEWDFPNLPGEHNQANALAAVAAARWMGASPRAIRQALAGHRRLHHRLEEVGVVAGVRFVDDSKATNPASVEAALTAFHEPLILLAGGKDKGTDFTALGRAIARRVRHLVLMGEAAPRLEEAARRAGMSSIRRCASLEEAVRTCLDLARPGDVVLLSPACASFDMFRSAEDRGEQFAAQVRLLQGPPQRCGG